MKSTVFATFTLEAAHRLENVPDGHKCKRVHGHTYDIRVEVTGDVDPALGWVLDYFEIAEAWRTRIYDRLDHRNINDALPELKGNTTSELLADWIRRQFVITFPARFLDSLPRGRDGEPDPSIADLDRIQLLNSLGVQVEVWETATCGAKTTGP